MSLHQIFQGLHVRSADHVAEDSLKTPGPTNNTTWHSRTWGAFQPRNASLLSHSPETSLAPPMPNTWFHQSGMPSAMGPQEAFFGDVCWFFCFASTWAKDSLAAFNIWTSVTSSAVSKSPPPSVTSSFRRYIATDFLTPTRPSQTPPRNFALFGIQLKQRQKLLRLLHGSFNGAMLTTIRTRAVIKATENSFVCVNSLTVRQTGHSFLSFKLRHLVAFMRPSKWVETQCHHAWSTLPFPSDKVAAQLDSMTTLWRALSNMYHSISRVSLHAYASLELPFCGYCPVRTQWAFQRKKRTRQIITMDSPTWPLRMICLNNESSAWLSACGPN